MVIFDTGSLLHWNYFLALEKDLENLSRYIEFAESNYEVYSIELAHLLITSSSEVDVVMKGICRFLGTANVRSIDRYRDVILRIYPNFPDEEVCIKRYGLILHPWSNWNSQPITNPDWWRSYNNVKHQRYEYYKQANLKNTLNAIAALLVVNFYYHRLKFIDEGRDMVDVRDINLLLQPEPRLIRFNSNSYFRTLIAG